MATTIDNYSTELGQTAPGNPQLYAPLEPNQLRGKVRISTFTRVYASETAGDDTALCLIPKGARILSGSIVISATGGSTTFAVGLMGADGSGYIDDTVGATVADNTGLLLAAQTITSTAKVELAATTALSYLYETKKNLYVTITTAAATIGTQTIKGHISWVVD